MNTILIWNVLDILNSDICFFISEDGTTFKATAHFFPWVRLNWKKEKA